MKSIFILALVATVSFAAFRPNKVIPFPSFDPSNIQGTWNINGIWNDTAGDHLLNLYDPQITVNVGETSATLTFNWKSFEYFAVHTEVQQYTIDSQNPAIFISTTGNSNNDMIVIDSTRDTFILLQRDSTFGIIISNNSQLPGEFAEKLFFQIPKFIQKIQACDTCFSAFSFPKVSVAGADNFEINSLNGDWHFTGVYAPKWTNESWDSIGCGESTYAWDSVYYNVISGDFSSKAYPDPEFNTIVRSRQGGGLRIINYISDSIAIIMSPTNAKFASIMSRTPQPSADDW
eukprot:CAMPEP_0114576778 /NCGR_PEP_ID=MMETSP0125-20121206/1511_1 /TAXON_ID=485358 ORGANISM="Aristerostoma sp., Strain ATCC 50986" /NCGR_SAMPLE_ID=MMETSP0125 /ASSEMBLY_ACC=CAM_ASM_000245 /LENGTH=288 /DNA_ID=CAMNT_0001765575 /DNA_START=76 /DNA_END=939 /DNA_ORIENTATION=-